MEYSTWVALTCSHKIILSKQPVPLPVARDGINSYVCTWSVCVCHALYAGCPAMLTGLMAAECHVVNSDVCCRTVANFTAAVLPSRMTAVLPNLRLQRCQTSWHYITYASGCDVALYAPSGYLQKHGACMPHAYNFYRACCIHSYNMFMSVRAYALLV